MDAEQSSTMTESNNVLDEDPFRNENTQRLFEAIDELRSCGANHEIGLPELVIVGDQSAGKSSLLQSLTDIPFPVADGLCTRFPTRIVSRRTPNQSDVTKISIEPNGFDWTWQYPPPADRAKRLEAYGHFEHSSPNITSKSFRDVVEEVKELMDIKRSTFTGEGWKTVGGRNFSSDVLKVEISGPDRSYFSILDVPGIFQSLTKGLTSSEKDGVRNMVASYMKPKHSIIIATNDLANQATFDMASEYDPELERTIGVITKCDITPNKDQILALAQNEEKHLNHGWFVVRNRTSEESKSNISSAERHSLEEALFGERPWDRLSEARRGTQALKRYLADILCSRIQETFPTILGVVQGRQALAESQLNKLGLSRDTTEKKRVYLTDLAQQLYTLSSQTLRGRYHGLSSESLKLRRFVREANDAFASKMIYHGCCVPFHVASIAVQGKSVFSQRTDTPKASTTSGTRNGSFFGKSAGTPSAGFGGFGSTTAVNQAQPSFASTASGSSSFANSVGNQKPSLSDNIPDIVGSGAFGSDAHSSGNNQSAPTPTPASKPNGFLSAGDTGNSSSNFAFAATSARSSNIYTWIREEIKNCRGTELQGTLNPDVLPALFHRQVVNWKETASSHFHSVATTTATIVELAARTTCGDKVTAGNIQKLVQQSNRASENRGIAQIHQRLDEIVTRHLQTQNPIFETNIREARLARFKRALERYRSKKAAPHQNGFVAPLDGNEMVIDLRDVTSLFDELHMSNGQNLEDDIHDTLKSYYELALHDFIEFVTQQVVESYLNDPTGPVLFFNPTYIAALGPQEIDDLGAEDPGIVKERMRLEAQLARLNRAEEIALKYS
ncbi:MAG: hypothetical protein LQ344_003678 [Seirophora lacunosa]|nr:MAG: hypothetical protein LQ344_003678 [Seirophora lacunosa]